MEWAIPLQKLELSKIRLGSLSIKPNREKKPMVPLAYMDGQMVMPVLTILLPHMTVDSYNSATGRLDLIMDSSWISTKLNSIQTSLLNATGQSQTAWFGKRVFTNEELYNLFQPMIEGNKLHLYCPSTLMEKRKGNGVIKIWKEDHWIEGVRPGLLATGQRVRVGLQIQGISLQLGTADNEWTGRCRLQHRVVCIFVQTPKTITSTSPTQMSPPPPKTPPAQGNL